MSPFARIVYCWGNGYNLYQQNSCQYKKVKASFLETLIQFSTVKLKNNMTFLTEGSLTHGIFIGFSLCVNTLIVKSVEFIWKHLLQVHPGVSSLVFNKIGAPIEGFLTITASKRSLSRVDFLMLKEM